MSIEKAYGAYIPCCDLCGTKLNDCTSFDEAVKSFKENGWKARRDGEHWINVCTDCLEYERSLKE